MAATVNSAAWIESNSPGALHAKLGQGRYVVWQSEFSYPEKVFLCAEFGGEAFGSFATVEEAKAAVHGHAMATYGDATIGVIDGDLRPHTSRNVG